MADSVNVRVSDSDKLYPNAVVVKVGTQEIIAGRDGVSPVVTTEAIPHGNRVTITDAVGEHAFDVMDGASAYEQAVAGGYEGTEAEFAEDLAGFSDKADTAETAAASAAQSAQDAADSASTATTKAGEAAASAATALTHRDAADSSAQSAAASATSAGNSASAAAASASAANGSATSASASESNAANSATNAAASETAAAASESAAAASATAASNSAAAAAQSASAIEEYEYDAEAWAIGKRGGTDVDSSDATYQNNSKYYAEQAAASSSAASSAASAAEQSATEAASEANSSKSYSRSAYISSTMASGSATAAAEAQTAAETAASTAEGHATNAASSATAASGSATAAATSESNAADSAAAASGSATAAATSESNAADSAAAAAASEAEAKRVEESIPADYTDLAEDVTDLKSAINTLQPAATAADVGKALIVKTVADGKPSAYEYGEAGGGGDATNYAPIIINSASGDIASFADGADGLPIKALTVNIEPIQAGSGDPSPDNVRPISGRTSATVTRTGANMWDEQWELGGIAGGTGVPFSATDRIRSKNFCPCKGNTAYYLKNKTNATALIIWWYDANQTFISNDGTNLGQSKVGTSPLNARYFKISSYGGNYTSYANDYSINYPATDTQYHPYHGNTYTIQLGDTVYGGTLDVTTGLMTVDSAKCVLGGGNLTKISNWYSADVNNQSWGAYLNAGQDIKQIITEDIVGAHFISDQLKDIGASYGNRTAWTGGITRTSAGAFQYFGIRIAKDVLPSVSSSDELKAAELAYLNANPIELVFQIVPQTYQLTSTEITALLGQNNIWSDAGDVDVDYRADTKLYIDNIHTPTDDDMTADAQIASGKYFLIGGNLYKSTTVIPAGDTIRPGTNCVKTNLAEALNALNA